MTSSFSRTFGITVVLMLMVSSGKVSSQTYSTPLPEFRCQNGDISVSPCQKGWFGSLKCPNKTLTCEQKLFCCPTPPPTTKPPKTPKGATTPSTIPATGTTTYQPISHSLAPGCDKCDLAARHSCFLSLHIHSNETTGMPNPDCEACENCCSDAFPHKCQVWKNHDFCDMDWYSTDKKRILCGKTCGIC